MLILKFILLFFKSYLYILDLKPNNHIKLISNIITWLKNFKFKKTTQKTFKEQPNTF